MAVIFHSAIPNTVRSGAGAPSNGLGNNGDFYIDTTVSAIYGPKTNEVWGSSRSLKGLAGPEGGARRFDASEFIPSTTQGCGIDSQETATNKVNRDFLTFDPGIAETAFIWFSWPSGWNTVRVAFVWTSTASTGDVRFEAAIRVFSDGDSLDSSVGSQSQNVIDSIGSANTHRQTNFTPTITPDGVVGDGKWTAMRVMRDATSVLDTLATDALLMGVIMERVS